MRLTRVSLSAVLLTALCSCHMQPDDNTYAQCAYTCGELRVKTYIPRATLRNERGVLNLDTCICNQPPQVQPEK